MLKLTIVCGALMMAVIFRECENATPYFPIEISRCLACNRQSTVYFLGALYLYFVLALMTNARFTSGRIIAFIGVAILGAVNDRVSWTAHMLGVAIAVAGAIVHVLQTSSKNAHTRLLCLAALIIYGLRLLMKVAAVVSWENMFYHPLYNTTAYVTEIASKAMLIMQTSQCIDTRTLSVFAYGGGLLQWVAVGLMAVSVVSPIKN